MKVIKFGKGKELDNIDTVKGLKKVLTDWIETVELPFDDFTAKVDELEYISRDGFSAFEANRGGVGLFTLSTVSYIMGSGSHFGTRIESYVESSFEDTKEFVKSENPNLNSEQLWDKAYDALDSDYDSVGYHIRAMYRGDGVLEIFAGFDTDAPYFRWNDSAEFEATIKFKTLSGLKRQLKKITKRLQASQLTTTVQIKVSKTKLKFGKDSRIGIHLLKPSKSEVERAIEDAHAKGFEVIYVHAKEA